MTPPEPISASSGWANTTMARSGTSVTISSFRSVGMRGILQPSGSAARPDVNRSIRGGAMSTPRYPGRIVQLGEADRPVVVALQERLVARGCGPLEITGVFDARTRTVVRLFQARFPDRTGVPLVVDGKVG